MKKLLGKNDLYLIGALLLAVLIFVPVLLLTKKDGREVRVSVNGETVAVYPLNEDRTEEIAGYEGGTNSLVIKDGEAYLTSASCPDHLCVHMGKIKEVGQSIICLPNRVTVDIIGSGEDAGYDTLAR